MPPGVRKILKANCHTDYQYVEMSQAKEVGQREKEIFKFIWGRERDLRGLSSIRLGSEGNKQCNLVTYQTGKVDTGGEPISLETKGIVPERGAEGCPPLWQSQRKLVTGKQAGLDRIFPVETLRGKQEKAGISPIQEKRGSWKNGLEKKRKAATFLGLVEGGAAEQLNRCS